MYRKYKNQFRLREPMCERMRLGKDPGQNSTEKDVNAGRHQQRAMHKICTLIRRWSAAHRSCRGILKEYSARTSSSIGTGFDSHSESYQNLTTVASTRSCTCFSARSPVVKDTSRGVLIFNSFNA